MSLYFIGLGLNDKKDISVKGLDIVKKCDIVYFDNYTSKLSCSVSDLEKFYGKKIVVANRDFVEKGYKIMEEAKSKEVAFLVIGDVFSATTHIELFFRAKKLGIKVKVVHNASVLTAVGITGLQLYKFGKVTSIPFENENIKTPIEVLEGNRKLGLHTLFLLDLEPEKNKFMKVSDAVKYLIKNNVNERLLAIGCGGLGSDKPEIIVSKLIELKKDRVKKVPQCLIVPGKLHFMEVEAIEFWRKQKF